MEKGHSNQNNKYRDFIIKMKVPKLKILTRINKCKWQRLTRDNLRQINPSNLDPINTIRAWWGPTANSIPTSLTLTKLSKSLPRCEFVRNNRLLKPMLHSRGKSKSIINDKLISKHVLLLNWSKLTTCKPRLTGLDTSFTCWLRREILYATPTPRSRYSTPKCVPTSVSWSTSSGSFWVLDCMTNKLPSF